MNKNKRLLALLALLLALSLFVAACGNGDTTTTTADGDTTTTTADDSDNGEDTDDNGDGRAMEGNMYLTGLPIVEEKVSFSLMVDDAGVAEDKWIFPILEEQTNVEVDLIIYPYEIAQERRSILLNSGDYPDVIGGWINPANDILTMGMGEQVFIPIDGLIEQYAPKIQEALDLPGVRQTMTLPDGHVYTIPYVIATPLVAYLPWINTEWIENVGMEMPETTDDLMEVLKAFRDMDANGDGDPNSEIPFSSDTNNMNLGVIAGGWFGLSVNNEGFTMVGDELVFGANQEEYKQGIMFLRDLYAEGLMDQEFFTQDGSQWKAKGAQGLYGMSIAYGPGDFANIEPGEEGPYDPLPVLRGSDDKDPVFLRGSDGVTIFRNQVVITDNAENPEVIIRWWDNLFAEENSIQVNAGPLGKLIEHVEDGVYRRLDAENLTEDEQQLFDWGNLYTQSLPRFVPVGTTILPVEGQPVPFDHKENSDAIYEPYLTQMIPNVWVTEEDARRMSILSTDIQTYIEQKQAEWITGQADIEAEWDNYVAQLDAFGVQELIEIRQRAIDANR